VSARVALTGIHYLLQPPKIISKTCEFSGMEVEVVYHFVLVDDTDLRAIRRKEQRGNRFTHHTVRGGH